MHGRLAAPLALVAVIFVRYFVRVIHPRGPRGEVGGK